MYWQFHAYTISALLNWLKSHYYFFNQIGLLYQFISTDKNIQQTPKTQVVVVNTLTAPRPRPGSEDLRDLGAQLWRQSLSHRGRGGRRNTKLKKIICMYVWYVIWKDYVPCNNKILIHFYKTSGGFKFVCNYNRKENKSHSFWVGF